jgi:hypothetical protein
MTLARLAPVEFGGRSVCVATTFSSTAKLGVTSSWYLTTCTSKSANERYATQSSPASKLAVSRVVLKNEWVMLR